MTRASLLHVLDHLSEISDAEVRELEQLATTFPYCQTAHILLAKAAHDRDSMLASQRLRRAATYATDRQLLRQLIEATPFVLAPTSELQAADYHSTSDHATTLAVPPAPVADNPAVLTLDATPTAATGEMTSDAAAPEATVEVDAVPDEHEQDATTLQAVEPSSAAASEPTVPLTATAEEALDTLPVAASAEVVDNSETVLASLSEPVAETPAFSQEDVLAFEEPSPEVAEPPVPSTEELLPAVAPPVRPPLEAGSSQFEFGLTESTSIVAPVYELLEADELEAASDAEHIAVTAPAFFGAADLGYALGAGSRLGYCVQSSDELTLNELMFKVPMGSFEPDALILAHLASHQPAAPTRTSIDIISQFLRNKPRLKSPAPTLPPADEQADLSVKSTRAEPDLASESLALIMVRQGKSDRAIEIYERLMVRQPEKMAYFADQIQKLKLSE
ncbi:hypothetical protein [Hymenobacter crusticola]|uniref:Uncharacterized protein n=1 Tax=Hymenobacter crusticola TaxID=1770526 RepID=A0A243WB27_9BACT|nr:hypothetical protein [Hymenobacter crusticola]OUJ71766.1 hypothetical protein BXP70_20630 [Hymenobacter crusticola]